MGKENNNQKFDIVKSSFEAYKKWGFAVDIENRPGADDSSSDKKVNTSEKISPKIPSMPPAQERLL